MEQCRDDDVMLLIRMGLLKPQCIECSSEEKDTTDVGVFCSRYKTGSLYKTRSNYQVFIG